MEYAGNYFAPSDMNRPTSLPIGMLNLVMLWHGQRRVLNARWDFICAPRSPTAECVSVEIPGVVALGSYRTIVAPHGRMWVYSLRPGGFAHEVDTTAVSCQPATASPAAPWLFVAAGTVQRLLDSKAHLFVAAHRSGFAYYLAMTSTGPTGPDPTL